MISRGSTWSCKGKRSPLSRLGSRPARPVSSTCTIAEHAGPDRGDDSRTGNQCTASRQSTLHSDGNSRAGFASSARQVSHPDGAGRCRGRHSRGLAATPPRRAPRRTAGRRPIRAQIGVAEADFYPAISILGTVGWSSEQFPELFAPGVFQGSIGPSFNWKILNYGRILNNVRLQDAKFQELVAAYQQSVLNADQGDRKRPDHVLAGPVTDAVAVCQCRRSSKGRRSGTRAVQGGHGRLRTSHSSSRASCSSKTRWRRPVAKLPKV